MVRPISFSVFLTFKCGPMQLYLLDPRPWPEVSYELGSICPSVLPSGSFFVIGSLVFSETQHGVRGHVLLCVTEPDFLKKIFLPHRWGKWAKNKVFNFFWIWSIMKLYIICCIFAQIPYLGKILFLRYGPKCFWPIRFHYF